MKRSNRPKGSTIIISIMFIATVAYVWLNCWLLTHVGMCLPSDVTYLVGAVFVSEVVSLARLKMAKEQNKPAPEPRENKELQSLGVYSHNGFDDMATSTDEVYNPQEVS